LGAAEGNKTKRSHFVFEKGGKLVDKKIPVKPNDRYVSNVSVVVLIVLPLPLFIVLSWLWSLSRAKPQTNLMYSNV